MAHNEAEMTEQKKKELKKAPKNNMNKKIFIQILKTILFSVIGGALGSLITFYFMSR